jgi:hypothetical protein
VLVDAGISAWLASALALVISRSVLNGLDGGSCFGTARYFLQIATWTRRGNAAGFSCVKKQTRQNYVVRTIIGNSDEKMWNFVA